MSNEQDIEMDNNKNNNTQSNDKLPASNSLPKDSSDNSITTENDNLDPEIEKEKIIASPGKKNINNNTESTEKSPASKSLPENDDRLNDLLIQIINQMI